MKEKKILIDRISGKTLQEALPGAEQVMNVYRHPDERRYYYGVLKMKGHEFWSEIDKNHLLGRLQDVACLKGYRVHTFAFTDDELVLLMSMEKDANQDGHGNFIDSLSESYDSYFSEKGVPRDRMVREHSSWDELHGREEILDTCHRIHSMPEKQGYIGYGGKHFWSGETQYDLRYSWSFLDMAGILGLFSADPLKGYRMFNMDQKSRKDN